MEAVRVEVEHLDRIVKPLRIETDKPEVAEIGISRLQGQRSLTGGPGLVEQASDAKHAVAHKMAPGMVGIHLQHAFAELQGLNELACFRTQLGQPSQGLEVFAVRGQGLAVAGLDFVEDLGTLEGQQAVAAEPGSEFRVGGGEIPIQFDGLAEQPHGQLVALVGVGTGQAPQIIFVGRRVRRNVGPGPGARLLGELDFQPRDHLFRNDVLQLEHVVELDLDGLAPDHLVGGRAHQFEVETDRVGFLQVITGQKEIDLEVLGRGGLVDGLTLDTCGPRSKA